MSSSDDDIMGLLPAGRGRGRGAPPARLRNFKAMMSSSSDEDEKGKKPKKPLPDLAAATTPTPTAKTPPVSTPVATSTPLAVVLPDAGNTTADSVEDAASENSNSSIQFLEGEGEKTDEVSMDLQSTMDDVTPARRHRDEPVAVGNGRLDDRSNIADDSHNAPKQATITNTAALPTRNSQAVATPTPVRAVPVETVPHQMEPPASSVSSNIKPVSVRPSSPPKSRPEARRDASSPVATPVSAPPQGTQRSEVNGDGTDQHEDNELLREILPLHPSSAPRRDARIPAPVAAVNNQPPAARTRSPSANTVLLSGAQLPPPSPHRQDPLEELLHRAQQRLKDKERLDQSLNSIPQPANVSRQASPMRLFETRRSDSVTGGRSDQPHTPLLGPASMGGDAQAREVRLQKENQRLAMELAFLTKENQRLRSIESSGNVNELSKLQVHIEVLKQQLKEVELEAQRTKAYLEAQLQDSEQHQRHLQDELKSYAATAAQVDAICREKDNKVSEVQQQLAKLQGALAEKSADVKRVEEEARRGREDDKAKLERGNSLFEDVKKQRVQLQELNEKFQRDKEAAIAERRRVTEEFRNAEHEWQRDRDRYTEEAEALRRDVERYRQLLLEKERTMNSQIAEEQRAKEHFQMRLAEVEENIAGQNQTLQQTLRATQEELRRTQDEQHRMNKQHTEQLATVTSQLDEQKSEFALRVQREKSAIVKEMSEKVQQWKEQRDVAEERRRVAEDQLERLTTERDQYRKELERCTEINGQWQRAKDKAEMQCVQLKSSLEQLIAQDEQLVQDSERYRSELDAAYQDVANMRADLEHAMQLEAQLQDLSAENDRISDECTRVTEERNELIQENAKMAEEMIKWRAEMKDIFSSQKRTLAVNPVSRPNERSASQRLGRISSADFTF